MPENTRGRLENVFPQLAENIHESEGVHSDQTKFISEGKLHNAENYRKSLPQVFRKLSSVPHDQNITYQATPKTGKTFCLNRKLQKP